MAFDLDKSAIKIKRLEEENADLKYRNEKLNDESMKIWERDLRISMIIDGILQNSNINMEISRKLEEINHHIKIPGDCKPISQEKVDELSAKIEELNIGKQEMERTLKMYETKVQKQDKKIEELTAELKKADSFDTKFAQMKSDYEKKLLDLNIQNDRLTDENNVRKMQLMKLQKQMLDPVHDDNAARAWAEKEQTLLLKLAKLEGMLRNKEKEFKVVWEKMEYYRKYSRM